MIISQNHIAINVSERDRSVEFYSSALGFEIVSETVRPEKNDILIFMAAHGIMLELFVDASRPARLSYPEALGMRHLCFAVTDIEHEWERISALGYEPEEMRYLSEGKIFFFKDPDGLPIEFHD